VVVRVQNGSFARGNARLFTSLGGRDFLNNQVQALTFFDIACGSANETRTGASGDGLFG
jgi:hypothetical protein